MLAALESLQQRGNAWPLARDLDDSWRPLGELADPAVRADVCGRITQTVGGCEPRVAESTLLLGLAARLWSLTVGSVVLSGVLPDLQHVAFRDDRGSVQLGLVHPQGWKTNDPQAVHDVVVEQVLSPIIATMALSHRLLWGNVASALVGAARVLELPPTGLVEDLLALPPLRGELDPQGRRVTCCLFYRIPGAGLCVDCGLDRVPAVGRHSSF